MDDERHRDRAGDAPGREEHRPEDRVPRLDRSGHRLVTFGMTFVYWSAAVVCLLVAVAVLANLGSGERDDSEYLLVAGGAVAFGLLLAWTGLRSYRSAADEERE